MVEIGERVGVEVKQMAEVFVIVLIIIGLQVGAKALVSQEVIVGVLVSNGV